MTLGEKFIQLLKQAKTSTGVCEFESSMEELDDYLREQTQISVLEVEVVEKMIELLDEERLRVFGEEEDLESEDDEEEEKEEDEVFTYDLGDSWQ